MTPPQYQTRAVTAPAGYDDDPDTLRWALTIARAARDPALPVVLLGAVFTIAGFALLGLAWWGTARTIHVPLQTPYIVSGGIAGLAFITLGILLALLQTERRDRAIACLETDQLINDVTALVDDVLVRRVADRRSC